MEENIREIIRRELPALITQDPQLRDWVWHLIHEYAPSRAETESRFEQTLAELRAMREESERKWAENLRKWEENDRRWEENQRQLRTILEQIEKVDHRIDRTIGALGARWGVASEVSFRNALKAILEKSFGVIVEHVEYHDASGEVFGRPDQVELDVLIHDGEVLACEIKSSASRADIYTFERKVRSYEKRTHRKVDRMLLISPMVKEKDQDLARELGIEVYSDAEEVLP
ncbi:MAG: DUF3782 domain-containing protein [Anaerolineales bacterium]|nr:DUF3782 domain-containing protein [Anaerolineales bacterium]MDW8162135.1 DUF3782 domain-containing protein [Anaerolineales bacterium]